MNLMLVFLFICVAIGLRVETVGIRSQRVIAAMAAGATALYLFGTRFL